MTAVIKDDESPYQKPGRINDLLLPGPVTGNDAIFIVEHQISFALI